MAARGNHSRRGSSSGATAIKLILLLCVVLVMAAAGSTLLSDGGEASPAVTPSATPEGLQEVDNLVTSPDAQTTEQPTVTPGAAETPPVQNLPRPPEGTAAGIGADIAVPASAAVDDSYFADAVFVGNSRTQGLQMYGGVTGTTFWTKVGLTVDSAFKDVIVPVNNQWYTVADALRYASYNKVYIMLGMNELGWVYESVYKDDYAKLIDVIQESHPDAVIYVQSIIPVSKWKETNDSEGTYTNANVMRLQKVLVEMCKEKGVNYVNVAEVMQDTDGCLFSEATEDGTHLTAEYCKIWMDYLRTHTVQ